MVKCSFVLGAVNKEQYLSILQPQHGDAEGGAKGVGAITARGEKTAVCKEQWERGFDYFSTGHVTFFLLELQNLVFVGGAKLE